MTTKLLPTYPTWRINFSVRVNLVSKLKGRFAQKEKFESIVTDISKKDVYQDIADERKQIENAELELQKIREERKKMDEILNRLRKALELKDNKDKDEKGKKK
jgi:histidyl-tRNA synthetase